MGAELIVGLPLVAFAIYGVFYCLTNGRAEDRMQERLERYCTGGTR